jgi:general stress protein 26
MTKGTDRAPQTAERVAALLAAAHKTMAKATDWWAATPARDGGVNIRVVVPIPGLPQEDACTKWFVARGSSRKADDIRRSGRITLCCRYSVERAYVVLQGRASVVADRAVVHSRWSERFRTYFPGGPDDPDTALVKAEADRIELCIPGSSPEPFGIRYAALERSAVGWRIVDE